MQFKVVVCTCTSDKPENDQDSDFVSHLPNLRPRLHETGTKSNGDHFFSVIVLFIIDVYMRSGQK